MKILLINTSEKRGGAAVACGRLMKALQNEGLSVNMLVRDKSTANRHVIAINTNRWSKLISQVYFYFERLIIFLHNGFDREKLFTVSIANSGMDISAHSAVKEADIIHLHWVNQGFLSLNEIKRLTQLGKPIVWTMHDMWPATAICHHSRECLHYQTHCHHCFLLNSKKEADLSNKLFEKKRKIWLHAQIRFVSCSKWLERRTKESGLINKARVCSIPNPLDIDFYHPNSKENARNRFNLPQNKKLLLYGAANITDKRKGIDYYTEAIRILENQYPETKESIELVFFGDAKESIGHLFPYPIHQIGYLREDDAIRDLYCAVDLFVTPSLEENLPNTIMESMSCGTPCVGFEVGGIPEMIDHKINGYLSKYKSAQDLADGIYWVLWNADYKLLAENARKKVVVAYSERCVAKQYIELYQKLIDKK